MESPGMSIKHPKQRGEWAELLFMIRAAEHGFVVAKPWGESSHYDFAVECNGGFHRVQVKSTMSRKKKNYGSSLRGNRVYYTKDDVDFIAAYVIPCDIWYIVPAAVALTGRQKLYLSPEYRRSIYEPYREAWRLLFADPSSLRK